MIKVVFRTLIILFTSIVLFSCQVNTAGIELVKVSISNSKSIGKVNTDFFVTYDDDTKLETIRESISNAVMLEGVVNVVEPEFDFEVTDLNGNKRGYHLWLGEKDEKSTLMKTDDTHTAYYIPEEMTNQLISLLK